MSRTPHQQKQLEIAKANLRNNEDFKKLIELEYSKQLKDYQNELLRSSTLHHVGINQGAINVLMKIISITA